MQRQWKRGGARDSAAGEVGALRPDAHLLPALFDRLCDDAPWRTSEAPGEYAVTRRQMHRLVQRDLANLLNAGNMEPGLDIGRYRAAAASTINFGVASVGGGYAASRRWEDVEKLVRRAIIDFEPRLSPHSIELRLQAGAESAPYNELHFQIIGVIPLTPYPMQFMVQSYADLELDRICMVSME